MPNQWTPHQLDIKAKHVDTTCMKRNNKIERSKVSSYQYATLNTQIYEEPDKQFILYNRIKISW